MRVAGAAPSGYDVDAACSGTRLGVDGFRLVNRVTGMSSSHVLDGGANRLRSTAFLASPAVVLSSHSTRLSQRRAHSAIASKSQSSYCLSWKCTVW